MNDSNAREYLDSKHQNDQSRRMEGVKRWVEYIKSNSPETWGPQQNSVVEGQLTAAEQTGLSATHLQKVQTVAEGILREQDNSEDAEDR